MLFFCVGSYLAYTFLSSSCQTPAHTTSHANSHRPTLSYRHTAITPHVTYVNLKDRAITRHIFLTNASAYRKIKIKIVIFIECAAAANQFGDPRLMADRLWPVSLPHNNNQSHETYCLRAFFCTLQHRMKRMPNSNRHKS